MTARAKVCRPDVITSYHRTPSPKMAIPCHHRPGRWSNLVDSAAGEHQVPVKLAPHREVLQWPHTACHVHTSHNTQACGYASAWHVLCLWDLCEPGQAAPISRPSLYEDGSFHCGVAGSWAIERHNLYVYDMHVSYTMLPPMCNMGRALPCQWKRHISGRNVGTPQQSLQASRTSRLSTCKFKYQ